MLCGKPAGLCARKPLDRHTLAPHAHAPTPTHPHPHSHHDHHEPPPLRPNPSPGQAAQGTRALCSVVHAFAELRVLSVVSRRPLCVDQTVERITSLTTLLRKKIGGTNHELVLNIVGAINNISFYRNENNQILAQRLEIAELIVALYVWTWFARVAAVRLRDIIFLEASP